MRSLATALPTSQGGELESWAGDSPIKIVRDLEPAHEPCFHFLRRDVVLGTVYWDDGLPARLEDGRPSPPRPVGWWVVLTGSSSHDEIHVPPGPASWRAAVRSAYRYLADRRALRSSLTPAQSRQALFFQPGAVNLVPVAVELP
jgi:hypothetical protein